MNAPLRAPYGQLLQAAHDYHGLRLDLYGALTEDGYQVQHVCIPGSLIAITECASAEAMDALGAALDDTLPSAEQLRKASSDEARAENAEFCRLMASLPGLSMPP